MKKYICIMALFISATFASAVTLKWDAAGVKFDGTSLGNSTAVTGYLIYLGTSSLKSDYDVTKASTVDSIISSIGQKVDEKSKPNGLGKLTGNWTFNYSDGYSNGANLAVLLVYATSSATYYNLSSSTVVLKDGNDADVETLTPAADPSNVSASFSFATAGEKNKLSKGGGWTVAVPEPSTAMLALAGLALLIKRRRA